MTDHERRLAEALRDLCGWHVGMVDMTGRVVWATEPSPATGALICHLADTSSAMGADILPDLNSPANWGHWEDWCADWELTVEVSPTTMEDGARGWLVTLDGRSSGVHVSRGGAMLAALCVGSHELLGDAFPMPPSVLTWWGHEQGGAP